MSYLQLGGQRYTIAIGELTIGSDASCAIQLSGEGVAPHHAIVQGMPDGQVAVRKADEAVAILINGVSLGPQPSPLLHGDKVEIAGEEFLFVDERRSGSTQYVQAMDPAMMAAAAKQAGKRKATAATGGRLLSLTDGREYTITTGSIVIGRDAGCDVVITSKNVSRRHAEIMATPKGYLLIDSSTNGIIVNGKRVESQALLARGDMIQCGEHEFRFYADLAPDAPPPKPAPPPPTARAPAQPAAAKKAPPPRPAVPPTAPAGAEHRLSNTLHGIPGIPRGGGVPVQPRPQPSGPLASLIVRSGPLKGRRFAIRVPVVNVGRAEYNDIVLPDESVSTTHAKLQRREGIWVLVDLDSTNGTLVDGDRVQGEAPLASGAFIRFGDVQTVFEPTDDDAAAEKGSSTKVMGAIRLPDSGPSGSS